MTAAVAAFLDDVPNATRREDGRTLVQLMERVTGEPPVLWGSIVGFGSFHYRGASGRSGDWPLVGFSPRKANLVVYLMDGFADAGPLLERLGPHRTGKACLYLKRLADVDLAVLEEVVRRSAEAMRARSHA